MNKKLINHLENLSKLIRYDILTSTTEAGSGHPTSSLSAVELMVELFFNNYFKKGDRFILSKGHASPLLYSLYHAGGLIDSKELLTLRKFGSRLEGHPNPRLPYVDVATGSLGQGLSVGLGMALGLKLKFKTLSPKIWVLMGDSEMAEGQIWEAMGIASYYKVNNLVGIIDVNRLGQYGETVEGWDIYNYQEKVKAFGWEPVVIKNGHNFDEISACFNKIIKTKTNKPVMVIAKTIKGKGVSFLENKNGWHGKALNKDQLKLALKELGKLDLKVRGKTNITKQASFKTTNSLIVDKKTSKILNRLELLSTNVNDSTNKTSNYLVATREAYGDALVNLGKLNPNIVVLDAEVANSTFENKFQKAFPNRFFEMFIAEENMMSVALGLSKIGYVPFVSTFAAFLTQTYDQIRMAQYSKPNLKIVGSHAGVSIGADGPSQMGLEDIAMMRSILNSVVFYPSDAISTKKIVKLMSDNSGLFYLRTTREKLPTIYTEKEQFEIGGLKIHASYKPARSIKKKVLVITAGITLHEAFKAQKKLIKKNVEIVIVDLYCIKPLNNKLLSQLISRYKNVIVVEDHYPYGGIGEAISSLITMHKLKIKNLIHLAVNKIPTSGTPNQLLSFEEIDEKAIVKAALYF